MCSGFLVGAQGLGFAPSVRRKMRPTLVGTCVLKVWLTILVDTFINIHALLHHELSIILASGLT